MSNNINQQNFSQEDLAGVMSSGASGGGRRGGGSGRRTGGSTSGTDFMVGQMGGITSTNGLGFNYVDRWGKSLSFTGSYFFNQSRNENETDLQRQFFETEGQPSMTYDELQESMMKNWNHRLNMKLDWQPDRNNSLQFRPQFSFQDNSSLSSLSGENLSDAVRTALTQSSADNSSIAYNAGGNLVYRHRFNNPGRTISLMLNGNYMNSTTENLADYMNWYANKEQEEYSQLRNNLNAQYTIRGNVSYTETLAGRLQFLANYKASFSDTDSDKRTYDKSPLSDLYDQLDESLSNVFTSGYLTQSAGVGLRYSAGKFNVNFGGDFQYSFLGGKQTYPAEDIIGHHFWSFLPNLTARYSVDRANSLNFRYRASSSSPSISELQSVVDNSNPLYLSTGNPELDQQISHSANLRYIHTASTGHTFIVMAGATLRQDYVADSTYVAVADEEIAPGIILPEGAQLTKPVNMDGYYSFQGMLTYGFPLDFIRSNLNLSLSANYANVPVIYEGLHGNSRDLTLVPKAIIGSNISRNLDFTVTYSAGINRMFSTLSDSGNGGYVNHAATMKFGWTFWKGFTLRSNLLYSGYSGLEDGYTDYWLWSASFGKKFLKNKSLEVALEANDILNQNMAFSHSTGSSWYDYINQTVLKQYFMLKVTWNISPS